MQKFQEFQCEAFVNRKFTQQRVGDDKLRAAFPKTDSYSRHAESVDSKNDWPRRQHPVTNLLACFTQPGNAYSEASLAVPKIVRVESKRAARDLLSPAHTKEINANCDLRTSEHAHWTES
jgi:hypothetical protein